MPKIATQIAYCFALLAAAPLASGCGFVYNTARPSDRVWLSKVATSSSVAELKAHRKAAVQKQAKWALGFFGLELGLSVASGALVYHLFRDPPSSRSSGMSGSGSGSSSALASGAKGLLGLLFLVVAAGAIGIGAGISGLSDLVCGSAALSSGETPRSCGKPLPLNPKRFDTPPGQRSPKLPKLDAQGPDETSP